MCHMQPAEELGPDLCGGSLKLVSGREKRRKNSSSPSECEWVVLTFHMSVLFVICALCSVPNLCGRYKNCSQRLWVPVMIYKRVILLLCPVGRSVAVWLTSLEARWPITVSLLSFITFLGGFARIIFLLDQRVSPPIPRPQRHSVAERPSVLVHSQGGEPGFSAATGLLPALQPRRPPRPCWNLHAS